MGKPDALSCRTDHRTSTGNNSDIVLLSPKLFIVYALEGVKFIGPEQGILQDICKRVKHPEKKPITKAAQEL